MIGDWAASTAGTLLNAFRHQRFPHRVCRTWFAIASACSTPFGIRGSRIPWQRSKFGGGILGCSTPFGIRGSRIKRSASEMGCQTLPAQRLSASEVPAYLIQRAGYTPEINCSTPFGIRGSRITEHLWNALAAQTAQRLSASEVPACSVSAPLPYADGQFDCSTPFGIRGSRICHGAGHK